MYTAIACRHLVAQRPREECNFAIVESRGKTVGKLITLPFSYDQFLGLVMWADISDSLDVQRVDETPEYES